MTAIGFPPVTESGGAAVTLCPRIAAMAEPLQARPTGYTGSATGGRAVAKESNDIDFRAFARSAGTIVRYQAGETIFARGDAASHMWIVLSGSVEIESASKLIEVVGVNYAIGIISLIDQLPRSATARAREDVELVRIDAHQFKFMVEEMPNFGWYVMRQLADRLRATNAAL
jgi:CRP-like cAMP-binding protein